MINVNEVVQKGLCSGCGACAAVCPAEGAILMGYNDAGFLYAKIEEKKCVGCKKCVRVCPKNSDNHMVEDNIGSHYLEAVSKGYIGKAADPEIRANGQSGGVLSALLCFLLETGEVEGAVVSRFCEEKRSPVAVLAKSREDIIKAQGSYYCQTDNVRVYAENKDKELAMVLLGCQARALSNMKKEGELSCEPIKLGVFCGGVCSKFIISDLINKALPDTKLRMHGFRFRDKNENGNVVVFTEKGNFIITRSERIKLFDVWRCHSCNLCLDFFNMDCDIVFGDPWGIEMVDHPDAVNVILARTARGEKIIEEARRANAIDVQEIDAGMICRGQNMAEDLTKRSIGRSEKYQFEMPFRYCGDNYQKMGKETEKDLLYTLKLYFSKGDRLKSMIWYRKKQYECKEMIIRVKKILKDIKR